MDPHILLLLPLALLALLVSSASSSPLIPESNSTTASPSPSTNQTPSTSKVNPIANITNTSTNGTTNATTKSDIPKPSYTRTMLKVSRSLPGETEELKVRTSEGKLATLIVKRQGGQPAPPPPPPAPSATLNEASSSSIWHASRSASSDSWRPVNYPHWRSGSSSSSRGFQSSPQTSENEADPLLRHYSSESRISNHQQPQRTNIGANTYKLDRDSEHVPAEVVIRSHLNVKPQPGIPGSEPKVSDGSLRPQQRRQPSPLTIGSDGVPVVHGKRVPDDPIDSKQVWRNARVINDQLVTESLELQQQQQPSAQLGVQVRQAVEQGGFDSYFEDVNRRLIQIFL